MKIHYKPNGWQYWYDRSQGGNWWAARFDAEGNQINDAQFSRFRDEIEQIIASEKESIADKLKRNGFKPHGKSFLLPVRSNKALQSH